MTASTAWLVSGIVDAQAEIVPSSVAQMKVAGMVMPGTRNVAVGFHTIPVGAAGVGLGGWLGSTGLQAVVGTLLPGSGIFTCRGLGVTGWGTPAPS